MPSATPQVCLHSTRDESQHAHQHTHTHLHVTLPQLTLNKVQFVSPSWFVRGCQLCKAYALVKYCKFYFSIRWSSEDTVTHTCIKECNVNFRTKTSFAKLTLSLHKLHRAVWAHVFSSNTSETCAARMRCTHLSE